MKHSISIWKRLEQGKAYTDGLSRYTTNTVSANWIYWNYLDLCFKTCSPILRSIIHYDMQLSRIDVAGATRIVCTALEVAFILTEYMCRNNRYSKTAMCTHI